jgi:hypothetical protein
VREERGVVHVAQVAEQTYRNEASNMIPSLIAAGGASGAALGWLSKIRISSRKTDTHHDVTTAQ